MSDLHYHDRTRVDDVLSILNNTNGWNDFEDAIDPSQLPELIDDIDRRIRPIAGYELLQAKKDLQRLVLSDGFQGRFPAYQGELDAVRIVVAVAKSVEFLSELLADSTEAVRLFQESKNKGG